MVVKCNTSVDLLIKELNMVAAVGFEPTPPKRMKQARKNSFIV